MDYTENYLDNNLNLYLPHKFPNKFKSKNSRKKFRSLKKTYAPFLRIKNHETEYRVFNILNKISLYLII